MEVSMTTNLYILLKFVMIIKTFYNSCKSDILETYSMQIKVKYKALKKSTIKSNFLKPTYALYLEPLLEDQVDGGGLALGP